MKNVLIIGELYSDNLGDGIICNIVCEILHDYNIEMLDLSGRNNYPQKSNNNNFSLRNEYKIYIKEQIKKKLKENNISIVGNNLEKIFNNFKITFEKKIKEYKPDVIVFAGGQLFMNCFFKPLEYVINYAEEKRIPVIFNACGAGNIFGQEEKNSIKRILSSKSIKYISVRDGYSFFEDLKLKNKIVETYDTAILCSDFYKINTIQTKKVGLGIMISHNIDVKKQIKFWKRIICDLEKQNEEWEIFCNGSIEDYESAKYILKLLHLEESKHLKRRPTTPNELISDIKSYKKIISMRLHSLIVAYSYNIPALAVSWDPKVETFYNKIKKEKQCFNINSNIYDILKLFSTLTFISGNKKAIKNTIQQNLENIIEIINEV